MVLEVVPPKQVAGNRPLARPNGTSYLQRYHLDYLNGKNGLKTTNAVPLPPALAHLETERERRQLAEKKFEPDAERSPVSILQTLKMTRIVVKALVQAEKGDYSGALAQVDERLPDGPIKNSGLEQMGYLLLQDGRFEFEQRVTWTVKMAQKMVDFSDTYQYRNLPFELFSNACADRLWAAIAVCLCANEYDVVNIVASMKNVKNRDTRKIAYRDMERLARTRAAREKLDRAWRQIEAIKAAQESQTEEVEAASESESAPDVVAPTATGGN